MVFVTPSIVLALTVVCWQLGLSALQAFLYKRDSLAPLFEKSVWRPYLTRCHSSCVVMSCFVTNLSVPEGFCTLYALQEYCGDLLSCFVLVGSPPIPRWPFGGVAQYTILIENPSSNEFFVNGTPSHAYFLAHAPAWLKVTQNVFAKTFSSTCHQIQVGQYSTNLMCSLCVSSVFTVMWMTRIVPVRIVSKTKQTCHHVSDRSLSLHPLISSSLSSVSTSCPISSPSLFCSSSSMWSELPSNKSPVHPQNEEYGPVAIYYPLTGHEPNQLDIFDYSETYTAIFQNESVDIDTEPLYSCDAKLDEELIGKALSSPLFIQERRTSEPETSLSLSWRKFVASSVLFHPYKYGETRVRTKFRFVSKTEIKSRPGKRAKQDSPWKTKKSKFLLKADLRFRSTNFKPILTEEVSRN